MLGSIPQEALVKNCKNHKMNTILSFLLFFFFFYCYFSSFVSIDIYIYTYSSNYLRCVPFTTAKLAKGGWLIALVPYHLKALNVLESIKLMQFGFGWVSWWNIVCLQIFVWKSFLLFLFLVVFINKTRKSYKHTDCFHFTQITDKNLQFPFKNWRFSSFTMFLLHSWSSVDADFCISPAYLTSGMKQSFWF